MDQVFFKTPNAFIFGYGINEPYSWVIIPAVVFAGCWLGTKVVFWAFGPENGKRTLNESLWSTLFMLAVFLGVAWSAGNTPEVLTYTEAVVATLGVAAYELWRHHRQAS